MENSYFWSCANVGDGGPDSFSQEKVMTILGMLAVNYSPETAGVIPWKSTNTSIMETLGLGGITPTGELSPTSDGTTITIASGIGSVGGTFYINTSPLSFNIAANKSGLANAADRIVLRRSLVSQVARLVYVPANSPGTTAPLVNSDTQWDVPIARINLNGSGNYSSLTDDRLFVVTPLYPPKDQNMFFPALIGENITDNIVITPTFSTNIGLREFPGIALPDNKYAGAIFMVALPKDIVRSNSGVNYRLDFRFHLRHSVYMSPSTGNINYTMQATRLLENGTASVVGSHNDVLSAAGSTFVASPYYSTAVGSLLGVPVADTRLMYFNFVRHGTDGSDTYAGSIHVIGLEIRYNEVSGQPDKTRQYIST